MYNFMSLALKEAELALQKGEIPVGAVIVKDNIVLSKAHNLKETMFDPTAHAEILAIRNACFAIKDWRLCDCDLYVTLEPCKMCCAAICESRLRRVYFGAYDSDASHHLLLNHCEVYGGIMQTECEKMLNDFFKNHR